MTDAPRMDGDALILSDTEIPFHNHEWMNKCIKLAREVYGVKNLWIVGDAVQWTAFASFPGGDKDALKEIAEIEDHIPPILQFDKVVLVNGNHDQRPALISDRQLSNSVISRLYVPPEIAAEWNKKVTVSDYFYGFCGDWRLTHPRATSVIPAGATAKIVSAHGTNVIQGHNHLVGLRQAGYDAHTKRNLWAVEIGCCVDPERLPYYMLRDTSRPKMCNGAAILRKQEDGFYACTLLTKEMFDWKQWKHVSKRRRNEERK